MARGEGSPKPPGENGGDWFRRFVIVDHVSPVTVRMVFGNWHVVAYRLWTKGADEGPWKLAFDGDSEDGLSDTWSMDAMAAGATMAFWIGVGGPAHTSYDVRLELRQQDASLEGGAICCQGTTDGQGAAVATGEVVFP